MDLQSFLQLLTIDHGPNSRGEYMCKCPAHEDSTASLCVNSGEKGIVIDCKAGCAADAVCAALGIKIKDLFYEKSGPAAKPSPAKAPRAETPKKTGGAKPGLGPPECIYQYVDASGNSVFEVVRYKTPDGKTFRQRRKDPDKKSGYDWSVPDNLRDTVYRLPEVIAGIRDSKTVYVVEGEKDADHMAALGYVATTNAGGAGKWRQGNSRALSGADVVIIPDCDVEENHFAGQAHAEAVAAQLHGIAKRVRVIHLDEACPEIPPKGDVTDFFKILGKKAGREQLTKLVNAAPDWEPSLRDRAIEAYNGVPGYHIDGGCISVPQEEGYRRLATFMAAPSAVITRDDGVTTEKMVLIEGWDMRGRDLGTARVPVAKFAPLNWVGETWDFAANIMPGTTTKDKLRYVIAEVGNKLAKHITEYTHTGWRKIGGEWVYLYHGGSIGGKNVNVELGSGLSAYSLDGAADIPIAEACMLSHSLKYIIAEHVAIPLLGVTYLAPLREFLDATGNGPSFSLFLLGGTGTRKSTASALALSHFGAFSARNLPASFNDTANYVRAKAFLLKDMPIVVDDYHPVTSLQERKRMESTAQSLSRAFGDGAERGRLRADLSMQESKPPRGVAILSGEDSPNVGESGIARYYVVHMGREDVPITEELTMMQQKAKEGALKKAMRGYIRWLLVQADDLPSKLQTLYFSLRRRATSDIGGSHSRMPEAIAHMMLGYQMMLMYMQDQGAFTQEDAVAEMERAWRVITENSKKQGEDMQEERPARMFLSAVSELIRTKSVTLCDLTTAERSTSINMVGYMDATYYYFMPEMAYRAVTRMYNDQGMAFPLTRRMLYRQLQEMGLIEIDVAGNKSTKAKTIDGKTQRLLWVRRELIDGPKVVYEQTKISEVIDYGDEAWPEGKD